MRRSFVALVLAASMLLAAAPVGLASEPGKLLIWADELRTRVVREVAKEFEQAYGIPVEVQELGFGDIRDNLQVTGPAGTGPDIIVGAHDWLGQLVVNGLLEPIDFQGREDEFIPVTLEAFTWDGKVYGLPYAFESIGLIYNKALVPSPPATFEELIQIAKTLTNKSQGRYGFALPMPDPYHTFPLMSAGGGYVFGERDGVLDPLDIGLNNEGAVAGLELFRRMLHDEQIMPLGVDYNAMAPLFHQGKLAMMLTGPWAFADAKKAGIDFGFAPVPSIGGKPARPFVGVQGFMISAFSKNKLLAQTFLLDYVATEETMKALFDQDPRPPAYIPTSRAVSSDPLIAGVTAAASQGIPMPAIPEMASVWTAWSDAIELVINKAQSPKQALDDAVARIRSLIQQGR
ncbi:MAG TPA: maltose/maltodextrin ABC transporter substrate-binding protein MalE [Limnochordales bacterium]